MNDIEEGTWPSPKRVVKLAKALHAAYRKTCNYSSLVPAWPRTNERQKSTYVRVAKRLIEQGIVKEENL